MVERPPVWDLHGARFSNSDLDGVLSHTGEGQVFRQLPPGSRLAWREVAWYVDGTGRVKWGWKWLSVAEAETNDGLLPPEAPAGREAPAAVGRE